MNFSEVELPSNKKFGFFFTAVFLILASYFWFYENILLAYIFASLSALLTLITILKSDILYPFNKLWMRFGFLLGSIISPIVLGLIFFILFTPIAFVTRLAGRDELRLHFKQRSSHWIIKEQSTTSLSFKQQF